MIFQISPKLSVDVWMVAK